MCDKIDGWYNGPTRDIGTLLFGNGDRYTATKRIVGDCVREFVRSTEEDPGNVLLERNVSDAIQLYVGELNPWPMENQYCDKEHGDLLVMFSEFLDSFLDMVDWGQIAERAIAKYREGS